MSKKYSYQKRNRRDNHRTNGKGRRFQKVRSFDPTSFIGSSSQESYSVKETEIINTFNDFKISDTLLANIYSRGYKNPTPIQDKSILTILAGQDLIGIANTGTGKTAAFLIPLIQKVITTRNQKVLIVTPTRELAIQIEDELYHFSKKLDINSALCIGGASINRRAKEKSKFCHRNPGKTYRLDQKPKNSASLLYCSCSGRNRQNG